MALLDGRVALVTGATRGIGREIALELAAHGADVALNHHPSMAKADMEALAEEIEQYSRALNVVADVSDPDQASQMVQQVVDAWGHLDILVNNAGITRDRTLRKMSVEEWQEVIQVDLGSVFYCTQAAIQVMTMQNYGRIVSISSVVAQTGNYGQANYAAAKAGILGFTRSAALELAKFNITVNAVCPGFTETAMTAAIPTPAREQTMAKIPLGRFARPEEIARVVRFLVAEGDYITGQAVSVNGGLYFE